MTLEEIKNQIIHIKFFGNLCYLQPQPRGVFITMAKIDNIDFSGTVRKFKMFWENYQNHPIEYMLNGDTKISPTRYLRNLKNLQIEYSGKIYKFEKYPHIESAIFLTLHDINENLGFKFISEHYRVFNKYLSWLNSIQDERIKNLDFLETLNW